MGRIGRGLTIVVAAAVLLAGGVYYWGYGQVTGPGPLKAARAVVVERGAGFDAIATALARAGVVSNARLFRIAARLTGADKRLHAGEYLFPAGIAARDVLVLLQSGRTVVRRVTVAEGLTTSQVMNLLASIEGLQGPLATQTGEGTLLPETYHYSWGDARRAVLDRMIADMEETLDRLWAGRAEGLPFKTPRQALILASIIEKETALPEERARIAAVFINRLDRGMRLQSDPTVVHGLTGGGAPLARALTRADLQAPSLYNTYVIDGLPPGPICNPGRAAMAAVLNPAATKELYFVADGRGGHVFARTLDEHNRNVARWRKIKKNIKER